MAHNWQTITSKSNPLIVKIAKLKDKKYRKAEELFRFDGIKLFLEAAASSVSVRYVFLSDSTSEKYKSTVEQSLGGSADVKLFIISDDVFAKLTDELSPEGIITVCEMLGNIKKIESLGTLAQDIKLGKKRVLLLESVRDTGNMGTVIRSAKAFGIDYLIVSNDCAELYNPKTVRAAMGALFTQNIVEVADICGAVRELRAAGVRVYAAALKSDAKRLGAFPLERGDAILIGNEGHGLSDEAIDACDECIFIPMEEGSESLNASIAASVCMWEQYRAK